MPRWSLVYPCYEVCRVLISSENGNIHNQLKQDEKPNHFRCVFHWCNLQHHRDVLSLGLATSTYVTLLYYILLYRLRYFIGNRPLEKFIRNYIRNSSGVFFISPQGEDIEDVISRFYTCIVVCAKILVYKMKKKKLRGGLKKGILFSLGKEQYFTHSRRSFAKYCFYHSKIEFISARCHVISSIYYIIIYYKQSSEKHYC